MREDKIDYVENIELDFYNELNNFVNKSYKESVRDRDELNLNYCKNLELMEEICLKIKDLEDEMNYSENIFQPDYSMDEMEEKINYLQMQVQKIKWENNRFLEQKNVLDKRTEEIESLIHKLQNHNYMEYLNKSNGRYKFKILRSQEFERKRIARDIHDSVIQKLTNMIHKTEFTLKIMDIDSIRAKLELMTISKSLREVIDEMRDIIYNLRPMAFDDIGIDVIIERELIKIKDNGIKVTYDVIGDNKQVDQIVQITLLRIIQEACNNALKHSNFTEFYVKILYNEDNIEIYIKDNGKGFDVPENNNIVYESKSGFGLSMMKERVYLLSGIINFESIKNRGTHIYVRVPKCFREENK